MKESAINNAYATFVGEEIYKIKKKKETFKLINDGITKKERICSFLMIGQSNMAGRGDFGEVEPIKKQKMLYATHGQVATNERANQP